MSNDDLAEDRETRIENLERKIEELTGEAFDSFCSEECSPELKEKFLESVLAFEEGQHSQLFDTLINGGLSLPSPEELNDADLIKKLWEVIHALSLLGVFLYHTDHLNDRELYEHLWHDTLREDAFIQPGNPDYAYHLDIIGSGSEEDIFILLKYYADEEERREWESEFSQEDFPAPKKKPYDRDCHLPKRENWSEGQC
ncbi:MAG: hypothetical protein HQM11_08425 [SAR324 cluster bacterium]|nr:hypothetical protein [SAR324 cluster bacterium]